ncbi:FMN-binding glutamate synthase family protein [Arcticibacterium luteifluviistationis]|uniref:FMN-binding glutamate synthase family protein n=1 Tax=Arcticibacterium luteifluviistationis TaxID=1784714 RepID=A0A2Z4GB83_9BACT|nr:FMN-binding glutamate synthase family protein [Arcticibacterium luteifluviistationis]AWV98457.1 FMN-binding glutamate synthase family protein [Arcticibacterium luteifluviistationis]
MKIREKFILLSIILLLAVAGIYIVWKPIIWTLVFMGPVILLGISDILQTKHSIRNNFPVIGNFRYLLEKIRPEIMQYFVETDTEGTPINRMFRSLIYQRAKKTNDTTPFGTQMDVYRAGYEWIDHSLYAVDHKDINPHPRVLVGGADCKQKYDASLLNISAMSFGSLSKNAILALNIGAKKGGFAHNTGEGGISPYHLEGEGDLIWQVGTGYFGCRTHEGNFCPDTFAKKATLDSVKMIEIKLSQGAKPGHGGILPAAKNTEEIAKIRDVKPHTDVNSPPSHSAFSSATGLMGFIKLLRDKSGGKPIGFKLCIGKKPEFIDICKAMVSTGIKPDFITIDGGEGGTGAAPIEFSNSIGMPLREGLAFAHDTLMFYDLKKDIKLIASGKIFTGFHIVRMLALGADMVNSARAMMLAIGCIQARECNTNTCPVGVATQNKSLMKGLNVPNKAERVTNFHHATLRSFSELVGAAGIRNLSELNRTHINRRISMTEVMNYSEIYPSALRKEV